MKYIIRNIDVFLIVIIFSLNIIRFILNIYHTSSIIYLIYICCIYVLYRRYAQQVYKTIKLSVGVQNILIFSLWIILYAIVSLAWHSEIDSLLAIVKYLITSIVAILCIALPSRKLKSIVNYILIINILYGIIILMNPQRVHSYMSGDTNYLNITLTLGLSLSISLISAIFYLFKFNLIKIVIYILLSFFYFLILIRFAARGVLIFPFIIALILIPLIGGKSYFKSFSILAVLAIIALVALSFYLSHANEYTTGRFLSMFSDTGEESRISIWKRSITSIYDKYWYILGGGVDALGYPHNMFIQYLGEYGIIGVSYIIYSMFFLWRLYKSVRYKILEKDSILLYSIFSATLYYFLTFNKSFTIYDLGPLQIMYVLTLALLIQLKPKLESD